jgi:DNA-binding response OmpR family regulator
MTLPEEPGRVLVVEDDAGVAELQRLYLTRAGLDVHVEADPARAVAALGRIVPDVIILALPPAGGGEVYRRIADASAPAPIICVTPPGTEVPAAAPYRMTRPFSPRLLVAMVTEALRGRAQRRAGLLRLGVVELDEHTRGVRVAGTAVTLTVTEFELLAFLLANPGRVFSREQLLEAAWGPVTGVGPRTVDVHVAQLRAKLGDGSPIRTVRGVGYAAGS